MYPIFDISDQEVDSYEQMGTKQKFWYTDSDTGEQYMFKSIHTEDGMGNKVERNGEDWAEKIACELAAALEIPSAHYELARYNEERGVRTKQFTDDGDNMFFGNHLIEYIAIAIDTPLEKGQRSQTLERVQTILLNIIKNPPSEWVETENIKTAYDVFIGYLLLDALISNQDRHSQNWAIIEREGMYLLAPSFDHAASLGRNESRDTMIERLTTNIETRKIPHYVSKCKSYFYSQGIRLKLLDAFLIFGHRNKPAVDEWFLRLEALSNDMIVNIVGNVPDTIMSDVEKVFCTSIIIANKARMLSYKNFYSKQET
jgi:hypothetical protein